MKCRVCRGPAVIDVRRHNANFCAEHFVKLCRDQTAKAIHEFAMLRPGERVLVAVSGGKDSLALWDLLIDLGYQVDGLYLGLGIGDYSDESGQYARRYARERGLTLHEVDLRAEHGFEVPTAAAATRRVPCSACGISKRHLFDDAARRGGYDALATGHNLDDEAAVLFGNVLRWEVDYLRRQAPILPAGNGFPRKIKPLVRLGERETAAYCLLRNIDYQVEECPMAVGNRHLGFKEVLATLEDASPGTKTAFYFGFLDRVVERLGTGHGAGGADDDPGRDALGACANCGAPTPGDICGFCRLARVASREEPVAISPKPRRAKPAKAAKDAKPDKSAAEVPG